MCKFTLHATEEIDMARFISQEFNNERSYAQ